MVVGRAMRTLTKNGSKEDKVMLIASLVILSCVVLGSLFYVLFGNQLIESVYRGGFLDKPIESKENHVPLEQVRVAFSRIVLICITIQLIVVVSLLHRRTRGIIKRFFTATTHPINLAVFRIVLFFTLFNSVDVSEVVWFSQFPVELRFAPTGLEWLPDYLPINETWATASSTLFRVFCFTGMIGLFTRTSVLLTLMFGFYVLGIPQFFGKISHYHHLIWFLAILAVSRCGDVFSCDAIWAAWKRADHDVTDPPGPSRIYALPLRFVWLLIGVIYFFPGFWKLGWAGFDWALSDNLKFRLYKTWLEVGNWTPFFRMDHYPLLYKMAAIGTIIFEISFIFLIFFPRLRILAALGGLALHNMTNIFMRIPFWWLQACYVVLFDWNAIFHRIGRWFYGEEMYVVYDGNCKICRRTIASLRVFDIFGRVNYVNALNKEAIKNHGLHWLDSTDIITDMYAIVGRKSWDGFSAYRALATRIPILWPVLPFLFLWLISKIGNHTYRRVGDSRTCSIADASSLEIERKYTLSSQLRVRAVVAIGVFLLFANVLCGVGHVVSSWPFACYPTFERIIGPETEIASLRISVLSSTGETLLFDEQTLSRKFYWTRWLGLIQHILSTDDAEKVRVRLKALWRLWAQNDSSLQGAGSVQFYKVILLPIPPEQQRANPVRRELLFELKL